MHRFIFIFFCCISIIASGQDRVSITGLPTQEEIIIDGKLDEKTWDNANSISDFWMQAPIDGQKASQKTVVKIAQNDQFLYISALCYDSSAAIIQTLKRDNYGRSDAFTVLIDAVDQRTNGYAFMVNARGAQAEALVAPSGTGLRANSTDYSWDGKWYVATEQKSDHWTVEMALPLRVLRYQAQETQWGINFIRLDPGHNQTYVWSPVPRQFNAFDLGYLGILNWANSPKKKGNNIALIPYTKVQHDQTHTPQKNNSTTVEAGLDAKIAIKPSLNLDLTVNSDFSQVEVDQQVTNLTRFNIFFPERRQFFLENADVFNEFGQFADRPFYSRRIGLDPSGNAIPIRYGARLSGNLNTKTRIGILNMQSADRDNISAQNYTAVSVQRRILDRSSIKALFLNRQGVDNWEFSDQDFGRNAALEFNYSTSDGKIRANAGYIHSIKKNITNDNGHLYGRLDYDGQNFRTFVSLQRLGENYYADMGFNGRLNNFDPVNNQIVRIGYTQVSNMLNYYHYPETSKHVNLHWSGVENFVYINKGGDLNEWYTRLRHFIFFKNTSQLRFRLNHNYVDLIFPFAISKNPIPVGDYSQLEYNVQFNTDQRKRLTTEWFIVYGDFFNGNKLTYRGSLSYRAQPWGNFTLGLEQNDIWLPDEFGNVHFTLATARFEVNFNTSLFWTTFLQYNTQRDNFNINSRLQWRFAPVSDVFLVYTDNYTIENTFGSKSKSVVLKVNYWLSL